MSFLYNFSIAIYTLLIRIAALFNGKARAWVKGRKGWKAQVSGLFTEEDKIVWFHAASLGEFEQGRPVIEAVRKKHPGYKVLLTFYSPSGYLQKKNYSGADKVLYLPADCPRNTEYFIEKINPAIAVFIKYEFWFNYLSALKEQNVPVVFISVLFRKDQLFFKWYGGWFMKKLKAVNHFFLQDETSANLLKGMGVGQVTISGDTRFDRVADILQSKKENEAVMAFCEGNKVVLAGSTWHPDEKILSQAVRSFPNIKFVITPHEVKEERIKQLISTLQTEVALYTKDAPDTWQEKQVLIIDTIGVLSSIYRYADIAYIGGAFSTGLHNIQEPAVNGMPVIFGPKYHNFREAIELVKLEGAFSVSNSEELERLLRDLLDDEEKYQSACKISNQYMIDNTGATEAIMKGMEPYL